MIHSGGRSGLGGGDIAILLALLCMLGCSKDKTSVGVAVESSATSAKAADPRPVRIQETRDNLARFYLKTFAALIKSGYYDQELPITRPDHYVHRLWLPERDGSLAESLNGLVKRVVVETIPVKEADGTTLQVEVARFRDEDQYHRDQYAMNLSEMRLGAYGGVPLAKFVAGARLDYGVWKLSKRRDLPWTTTLLATNTPPGESWVNSAGERIDVPRVVNDLLNMGSPPEAANELGCYDYHALYALVAAVESGYSEFATVAGERLDREISHADRVCGGVAAQGDSMEAIVLRIKHNGHLLETFFRGSEKLFPVAGRVDVLDRIIARLLEDSRKIGDLNVYEGPPDIFTVVPHAIHGCDLALKRLAKR